MGCFPLNVVTDAEIYVRREFDWSNIPTKKYGSGSRKDWVKTCKTEVPFKFAHIEGLLTISYMGSSKLKAEYNKKEKIFRTSQLNKELTPPFKDLIFEGNFLYGVGDTVNGVALVVDRKRSDGGYTSYLIQDIAFSSAEPYWIPEYELGRLTATAYHTKRGRVCTQNSLSSTHPELIKYFVDVGLADSIKADSSKKVELVCPECNHIKQMTPRFLVKYAGINCGECGIFSYPERLVGAYLDYISTSFIRQFKINGYPYLYDFFLPELNLIIETHGIQHYKNAGGAWGNNLTQIQERDKDKERLAKSRGYKFYAIDARTSEFNFIVEQLKEFSLLILKRELNTKNFQRYFRKVSPISSKQLLHLFEQGESITSIAEFANMSGAGVTYRLRQYGVDTGKNKKVRRKFSTKARRKIVCINTREVFESCKEADEFAGTNGVGNCASGKSHYAGRHPVTSEPLRWKFFEDYIQNNNEELLLPYRRDEYILKNRVSKGSLVCLNEKIVFSNKKQAAEHYKCGRSFVSSGVSMACSGKRKSAGKHPATGEPLKWMYYADYIEKYGTEGLTEYVEEEIHNDTDDLKVSS